MARRRSRVLEYFEQQQQAHREATEAAASEENSTDEENPNGGGVEQPFRDFELAFGPDFFDSKGNE